MLRNVCQLLHTVYHDSGQTAISLMRKGIQVHGGYSTE